MRNSSDNFEVLQHQSSDRSVQCAHVRHVLRLAPDVCVDQTPAGGATSSHVQSEFTAGKAGAGSLRCSGRCVDNSVDSGTSQTVRTLGSGFSRDCHINKRHGHDGVLFIDGNNDADERTKGS